MKLQTKAAPESTFVFQDPPISGNAINGLGEKKARRTRYVFHSNSTTGPLPWDALQRLFRYSYPASMLPLLLRAMWAAFRPQGEVAARRQPVNDPVQMARRIKRKARELGAGVVGICEMRDEFLMQGVQSSYRYAISLGLPMDRERMLLAPLLAAGKEVLRTYIRCSRLTVDLARYIRSLGWEAQALPVNSSGPYLHIPIAVAAGLGQLGKHGSLICKEYGSNFRLTSVLTNLPMRVDRAVDIGVDDLCSKCRVCVKECPPGAIFHEKQWVRGTRKWYVDFDLCTPYFSDNYGCAICLEVCPWSETGRGEELSRRLLASRERHQLAHKATGE